MRSRTHDRPLLQPTLGVRTRRVLGVLLAVGLVGGMFLVCLALELFKERFGLKAGRPAAAARTGRVP